MLFVLAQDLPPPPDNPNPAALVAWCTASYAILAALLSVLRPDNTALPIQVPPKTRAILCAVLTVVMGAALAVTHGTLWWQALLGELAAGIAAYGGHGERTTPGATPEQAYRQKSGRPPPFPASPGLVRIEVLLGIAGSLAIAIYAAACGLFTPQNAAAVATIDGAACRLAALQPNEPTWEEFVCAVLDPVSGKTASFHVRVPKEQAKTFAAAHAPPHVAGDGGAP